jgi:UDPglucose 6-dehydrogenase
MDEAKRQLGNTIEYSENPYDTAVNADCLVMVTEWNEFRFPDWMRIKSLLKSPVVFDGRNLYDVNEMKANGFDYMCIGINTFKKN